MRASSNNRYTETWLERHPLNTRKQYRWRLSWLSSKHWVILFFVAVLNFRKRKVPLVAGSTVHFAVFVWHNHGFIILPCLGMFVWSPCRGAVEHSGNVTFSEEPGRGFTVHGGRSSSCRRWGGGRPRRGSTLQRRRHFTRFLFRTTGGLFVQATSKQTRKQTLKIIKQTRSFAEDKDCPSNRHLRKSAKQLNPTYFEKIFKDFEEIVKKLKISFTI